MSTITRLTLDEYDRMIGASVFNRERRIELIHGELRDMSPIGDPHRAAVNILNNDWAMVLNISSKVRSGLLVQVQSPIRLPGAQSAPLPDMSWIARGKDSQGDGDEVFLVIEVADSSLDYDRGEKADLYAEAGIQDYWIVNLVDDCVEVCRGPKDGRYQSRVILDVDDEVRPLRFPDCPLKLSLLFGE